MLSWSEEVHRHGAGGRGVARLGGAECSQGVATGAASPQGRVTSSSSLLMSSENSRTPQTANHSESLMLMWAGRSLSAEPVPPSPVTVMAGPFRWLTARSRGCRQSQICADDVVVGQREGSGISDGDVPTSMANCCRRRGG